MKVLVTSALPYVNNIPHLGNITGSVLPGDVVARYHRLKGNEVLYICGADEYGTATEVKSMEEGMTPREVCDKYIEIHKSIYDYFNISFDYFGRTSTPNPKTDNSIHTQISQDIFDKLYDNGYLEEKEIDQWYCPEIDMYLADRFIIGKCPFCYHPNARGDQCDLCGKTYESSCLIEPRYKFQDYPLIKKTRKHLFLNLPKLFPQLTEWFEKVNVNWSNNAVSITKGWFEMELQSRCITRDLKWGTPINEKHEEYLDKCMYNWFDAPIGYISITANFTENWKDWWMNKDVRLIQTFSKDNVPFHSIMFPATLMGTNDPYTLVSDIYSCEYLTYRGEKFSKSNNIGIFGDQVQEISEENDLTPDHWRYYLMKTRSEIRDSAFNIDDFCSVITADLANNYGNFMNRIISLCSKSYSQSVVSSIYESDELLELFKQYHINMESGKLRQAIMVIMDIFHYANNFLTVHEPWRKYKINKDDPDAYKIKHYCLWIAYWGTRFLEPFIPDAIKITLESIKPSYEPNIFDINNFYHPNNVEFTLKKYNIIFKKIERKSFNKLT